MEQRVATCCISTMSLGVMIAGNDQPRPSVAVCRQLSESGEMRGRAEETREKKQIKRGVLNDTINHKKKFKIRYI